MSVSTENNLLDLEGVSKRFRLESGRELQVLENISLTVKRGEIIALLGPSGCGKTTTLKIMAGLIPPTSGQVKVQGKSLEGINDQLSMVFQSPSLLPWYSVEQNVELGLKRSSLTRKKILQRVEKSVDLVGLGGFESAYPRELSGGLRQRVGLARALAVRPEILCLDEPFSALDALTAEDLRAEVVDLWDDEANDVHTIVLVTHDIWEAAYMAQKVYVFGAEPGHIRTVLSNTLPYPRDVKQPRFQEFVDRIHRVITEALIPEEEEEEKASSKPAWYQGFENIPAVGPGEITGLLEVLDGADGKMDIFELANETESEFGHCLSVVKTAELLDFVDTPKQDVIFTDLGKRFIEEDTQEQKDIFKEQLLRLRIFQTLMAWLEDSRDKEIERDEVIFRLQNYFPNEKLDRLFDTLVSFGRYAELLSYHANTEVLTLPEEESEEEALAEEEIEAEDED